MILKIPVASEEENGLERERGGPSPSRGGKGPEPGLWGQKTPLVQGLNLGWLPGARGRSSVITL